MSSFINKSGKKVAPKAAPRRRLGGAPARPSPSVHSVAETEEPNEAAIPESTPHATPVSDASARQIRKLATTQTPRATASPAPARPPTVDSLGIPVIQSSSGQPNRSRASSEIRAVKASLATITPSLQHDGSVPPIITVSTVTRVRSASPGAPIEGSGLRPAKRRRIEEVVDVIQSSGSRTEVVRSDLIPEVIPTIPHAGATRLSQNRDDTSIPPVLQSLQTGPPRVRLSKSSATQRQTSSSTGPPVVHSSSRPSRSSTATERLVPYETPRQSTSNHASPSDRTPASATTNTTVSTATTAAPKSRAKGARKDRWQVTTPADLATGKGKRNARKPSAPAPEILPEADDELNQSSIVTVTPKPRKTRKDKGQKKTSKTQQTETPIESNPVDVSENRDDEETAAIDPEEEVTEEQEEDQPLTSAASKRLANLQKRKAKQLAKNAALSRATGRANAAIIDDAVRQSIEGRNRATVSRSRNTSFIAETPDRGATAGTDRVTSIAVAEMTEGGTVVRKRRSKRAETPEENESVFIVEGQTSMWDLANRDTENRVGFKSERERMMRQIDWKEVRIKNRAENERLARQARGKRITDSQDIDPEDEGLDEDERLARAVARNKNKRPGLQITLMANGEHVIDEQSQMIDRQALHDEELELLEEVEEDDLTKKFNVQTYMRWRRKEEDERVMVNEKWTVEQTERFYDALATFGTDFMVISHLFPGRTRRHIKSKFVREERAEPERIRDALTGHASRMHQGQGWDLETFRRGAGLRDDAFVDPRKIEEDLKRERVEREKEIEDQKAETREEERQRKLAGVLAGDDELGSDGEPLSPGGVVRKAREEALRKKKERMSEKKRKILEMAGGEEEIIESIEDD